MDKVSIHFTCSDDLKKWLEKQADKDGRSLSNFLQVLLDNVRKERD